MTHGIIKPTCLPSYYERIIRPPKIQMVGPFVSTETRSSSRSKALEFQTELDRKSFIWIGLCASFFNPILGPVSLILHHFYRKTNDEKKKFVYSRCIVILLVASNIVSLLVCVSAITYLSIPCEAKSTRKYVTTNNSKCSGHCKTTTTLNTNETVDSGRIKYFENMFEALDKLYGARDKNGRLPNITYRTL